MFVLLIQVLTQVRGYNYIAKNLKERILCSKSKIIIILLNNNNNHNHHPNCGSTELRALVSAVIKVCIIWQLLIPKNFSLKHI